MHQRLKALTLTCLLVLASSDCTVQADAVPSTPEVVALVDQAIALGFPDTQGAELFTGTLIVHSSDSNHPTARLAGVHARRSDGSWLALLTYPVQPSLSVTIDAGQLTAVQAKPLRLRNILPDEQNNSGRVHVLPPRTRMPVGDLGTYLQSVLQSDHLNMPTGMCTALVRADIEQPGELPLILMRPPHLELSLCAPIGPGYLGICQLHFGNSLAAIQRSKLMPPQMPPLTVLRYGLIHWFLANARGFPAPITSLPNTTAFAAARALCPSDDPTTMTQIRLQEELQLGRRNVNGGDAFLRRLITWHTGFADDMEVTQRTNLEAYVRDPHSVPDFMVPQLAAALNSRFEPSDLPALFGLLGNLEASEWIDRRQLRTVGDQALRAIASVLVFDPRCLIGRDLDALWTDEERSIVCQKLGIWWAANQQKSVQEIRLAALAHMDCMGICYLLKLVPAIEAPELFQRVAVMWQHGPPKEFDDGDVLTRAEEYPDFATVITQWPATGVQGPRLLEWQVRHGGNPDFDGFFDDILARDAFDQNWSTWCNDGMFVLGRNPQQSAIEHLLDILTKDPTTRPVENLMHYSLDPHRHESVITQSASTGTRPRDLMLMLLLARMLSDQRPAPPELVSWSAGLAHSHSKHPNTQGQPHAPEGDLRIADCAAAQAQRWMFPICGGLSGKADALSPTELQFDLSETIAVRNRQLAHIVGAMRNFLPTLMSEIKTTVSIPGFDDIGNTNKPLDL